MEQTVYLGSTTTDIVVYTQAIDSSGSHVALVVDTSTTKLVFANGTVSSATPTVTSLGTGKAKITFASIANSNLTAGDTVAVRVNGSADSINFSEYLISVFIATASSGGGGGGLTQADVRSAVGLASANLDTQLSTIDSVVDAVLVDTGTDIPASIAALNNFDPASDVVANVTAVGSVTNPVTTDSASRTASQADVSSLATAASISALNDFDPASDTVANVTNTANVTNAVETDAASRNASKADVSGLSTFDASTDSVTASNMRGTDNAFLAANAPTNFAALSINSSGHINRVVLVDTTTTNTDMVSVSGLSTFDASTDQVVASNMRGTDNALLAASAPSNFGSLGINASGHILRTVLNDTTTTNSDMVSVAGLAQSSEIAALNDISAADVWSYSTRTITSGGITAGEVSDAVWDVALSGYNSAGTTGKAIRQTKEGVISQDGQVNDVSATTTTFVSNLSSAVDGYYHDKVIVFVSGSLSGQARHIETYTGSTKSITVSQAFTSAPSNGDEFLILATHEHSLNEIADATWDEQRSGHTTAGSFGYYLDERVSQVGGGSGAADVWNSLLSDYQVAGSFGARFQEGTRFTNTDANIIYLNQGDSYDNTANPMITWAVTKDYTGYTVVLEITHRVTGATLLSKTIEVFDSTTLRASLSSTDTAFTALTTDADFGAHSYVITATSGSSVDSAVLGAAVIRKT